MNQTTIKLDQIAEGISESDLDENFLRWLDNLYQGALGNFVKLKMQASQEIKNAQERLSANEETVREYKKTYGEDAIMEGPNPSSSTNKTIYEEIDLLKQIISSRKIEVAVYDHTIRKITGMLNELEISHSEEVE